MCVCTLEWSHKKKFVSHCPVMEMSWKWLKDTWMVLTCWTWHGNGGGNAIGVQTVRQGRILCYCRSRGHGRLRARSSRRATTWPSPPTCWRQKRNLFADRLLVTTSHQLCQVVSSRADKKELIAEKIFFAVNGVAPLASEAHVARHMLSVCRSPHNFFSFSRNMRRWAEAKFATGLFFFLHALISFPLVSSRAGKPRLLISVK